MKLPEYMTIKYDPDTVKYICSINYPMYTEYSRRSLVSDMKHEIEQNEIKTGLQLLFKLWKIMNCSFTLTSLELSNYISLPEYVSYAKEYIDLKKYATDDLECFWSVISRYYPFTEEELIEYMKYINATELSKNMFTEVSEDTMTMIKCYEELNK